LQAKPCTRKVGAGATAIWRHVPRLPRPEKKWNTKKEHKKAKSRFLKRLGIHPAQPIDETIKK
jgi:hypothetical protein